MHDGVVVIGADAPFAQGWFGLLGQPPGNASLVVTHAWPAPHAAAGDSTALRERPQSSEEGDGDDDQEDEAANEHDLRRVCLHELIRAIP